MSKGRFARTGRVGRGLTRAISTMALCCISSIFASNVASAGSPDWSGLYAGVHAGGVWGTSTVTDTNGGVDPGPFSYSIGGPFGGATVGSNFQFGNMLVGVEGDLGYMDLQGRGKIESAHDSMYHQDLTLDGGAYGDLTGRAGFVFGQMLIYGKGGVAFYGGQAKQATTYPGYVPTGTGVFTGWTAGAGIESRLTPTMSVKLEYLHFDFSPEKGYQTNVGDTSSPDGYEFDNSTALKADSIKIGLNWKFGG